MPILSDILPQTLNVWINEYNLISDAQRKSSNILLLNNIERTRISDFIDGKIIIILQKGYTRLKEFIGISNYNDFHFINLEYVNDNLYKMTVSFRSTLKGQKYLISTEHRNYDEIIDLLTKILYYESYGKVSVILDSNSISFILTSELIDRIRQRAFNLYNDNINIILKRLAIWDTLIYLKI